MRELMTVIIDLAILIVVEVQANDPSSSSFHLSSHLISPSHPFNLDYEHLVFSTCLLENVERCKKIKAQVPELTYAFCVINSFRR